MDYHLARAVPMVDDHEHAESVFSKRSVHSQVNLFHAEYETLFAYCLRQHLAELSVIDHATLGDMYKTMLPLVLGNGPDGRVCIK